MFATKLGEIKRMNLKRIVNIRANGINSMDLEDGDELVSVRLANTGSDVLMVSQQGISIRFPSTEVRSSSRIAGGVRGMRLRNDDYVVAMDIVDPDGQLLVISERGVGKPTSLNVIAQHIEVDMELLLLELLPKAVLWRLLEW